MRVLRNASPRSVDSADRLLKCPCRTCLPLIRQASDEAWEATELILKDPLRSPVDRMLAIEAVQQKIRARVLELIAERRRNHPEG